MKKLTLGLLFVLGSSTALLAQKIALVSGDLSILKGQTELNIVYDYSSMAVGKFKTEAEYKEKKIKEANEKEAGKGDQWEQSWENDKTTRFPSKFEELFNKGIKDFNINASQNNENAKYTLIVKTIYLEPGFNIGVTRKNAAVSFEYLIVESSDHSKVLARMTQAEVPGAQVGGYDFDNGVRISESYAKAGKMLAAFIGKKIK
jgi:ribosomal protein L22